MEKTKMPMTAKQAQELYVAYFNRPADSLGLAYWMTKDVPSASAAFSTSAEYVATYAGMSNAQIINAIYTNLFGRAAEPAGITYWGGLLTSGAISVSNAVTQISGGAQGTDLVAYSSKVTAATAFTAALVTTAQIVGYSGTTANNAAKAWMNGITDAATATAATVPTVLTASIATVVAAGGGGGVVGASYSLTNSTVTGAFDAFTGTAGNDTFTAGPGAAETGDTIDGGAGTDTFNVRMTAAVTPNPTLSNVEKVYARLDATNVASTLSLGGSTGVTEVWADRLEDTDGTGNGTTLTVNGISKSVTLGVTGDSVAGTSGSRGNVTFALNDVTGAADSANLAFAGGGKVAAVTVADVETLNISSTGSVSNSAASIVAAAATTVKVSGTQQLSLGSTSAPTTVSLDVDATKDYTVDASGMSGTFRVVLEDQAAGKIITYTGGSGADRVFLAAGLDANDKIDGGAGTNSIGFTVAADLTTASGAGLKNFQVFDAGLATAGTYDMDLITGGGTSSTITNISVTAALAGATVISNLVDTGAVTMSASTGANALTINQKGAGDAGSNADTLTFNISPSSTTTNITVNSLVAANIETVTIRSNENSGYSTGHIVTGTTFANAATVNFTGNEQITVTTLGAAAASLIDASALGDKFIMTNASDAATVLLVKGSAYADDIELDDGVQLAGSTVQGNGGADLIELDSNAVSFTVKYLAQSDSTFAAFDQITNFDDVGEDLIDISAFRFSATERGAVLDKTAAATFVGAGAAATFTIAVGANLFNDSGVDRAVATIDNGADVFVLVDVNKDGDFSTSSDLVILLVGNSNTLGVADFVFV